MAEGSKQQLIEAFRLMPEGIQEFLETPIPEPPTIGTPGDVDSAIVASGIASKYICDLFQPFAGLTPIELLTRIGQHNSVLEIGMLAGLEYFKGDGEGPDSDDFGLEILEPKDGATYLPGELRIRAKGINGDLVYCAAEITDHAPVSMDNIGDGIFEGYLTLEDEQGYTVTVTGVSSDDQQVSDSASFTVTADPAEEPEPPGGTDDAASQAARGKLVSALQKLADYAVKFNFNAYVKALFAIAKTYYGIWLSILRHILKGDVLTALETLNEEAQALIAYVESAIDQKNPNELLNFVGKWIGVISKISLLKN